MQLLEAISKNRPLKRKLLRVAVLVLATILTVMASMWILAPNSTKLNIDYKYMHCQQCKFEQSYDPKSVDLKCLKCPTRDGTFIATTESIRGKGGAAVAEVNPWKWFNVAMMLEAVLFLGFLVFILKPRTVEEKEENVYWNCPHCKWRLRFRESLLGKGGQCPRCKRIFRFPETADHDENPVEEHVDL